MRRSNDRHTLRALPGCLLSAFGEGESVSRYAPTAAARSLLLLQRETPHSWDAHTPAQL